jgi:acyl-CoA dehydrogenase
MTHVDRRDTTRFIFPEGFSSASAPHADYFADESTARLIEFFNGKGLAALKDEDRLEQWYDDWLAFQAQHQLYARLLSPREFSSLGGQFDLLKLTRFLEVFGYFSPAHGYSLQVSFLGLFGILMGDNADLKREAVRMLEAGKLLAFGVSEKEHGSDLLGNEFLIVPSMSGGFVANGRKYYIGNANVASMICTLARKETGRTPTSGRRSPFALIALRPDHSTGLQNVRKIRTFGVRAAYVGEFEVANYELPQSDVITEGRGAWDGVLGTVTLGKFFLGFGSIGICEHAFEEASNHLHTRIISGRSVIEMPHIRSNMSQAYARLCAMKLFAYRALDYLHAASADDRRYLLFNAVQKAKLSIEGVKVIALLSECVGAKGFEADTYIEMALRDIQLIPGLEGSTHINLALIAQFISAYFSRKKVDLASPPSLVAHEAPSTENAYLMTARAGSINSVAFHPYGKTFSAMSSIPNVRIFRRQANAFALFLRTGETRQTLVSDLEISLQAGQCLATIAYAQLIAEHAVIQRTPPPLTSLIFDALVADLSAVARTLASLPKLRPAQKVLIERCIAVAKTATPDWDFVAGSF